MKGWQQKSTLCISKNTGRKNPTREESERSDGEGETEQTLLVRVGRAIWSSLYNTRTNEGHVN